MNYLVMQKEELEVLRKRARRGWVMFGIGMLLSVSSAFVTGYHVGKQRTYEQAAEAIDLMYTEQKAIYSHASYVKNTTMVERDLILNAAAVLKDREEIVRYNQENVCPDLQKATASRKR